MQRTMASMLCALTLAACTDGSSGSITSSGLLSDIPEDLRKNITAVSYDAAGEQLVLQLAGLDGGPGDLVYVRTPGLDIGPYQAYTYQDDPLDRHFTAMVAESNDGSVIAGAVADGGQFNRYFGGGFYQRTSGIYSTPNETSGLVSYAGTYAGVTNIDAPGAALLPITDPTISDDIKPAQAARVEGKIFLDVNFSDSHVNGSVYDRELVDTATPLPTIMLIKTDISSDGIFKGDIEFKTPPTSTIGTYGGIFGGSNASSVGGTLVLQDVDDNIYGWTGDEEIGVFVLTQCGRTGDDPVICAIAR